MQLVWKFADFQLLWHLLGGSCVVRESHPICWPNFVHLQDDNAGTNRDTNRDTNNCDANNCDANMVQRSG